MNLPRENQTICAKIGKEEGKICSLQFWASSEQPFGTVFTTQYRRNPSWPGRTLWAVPSIERLLGFCFILGYMNKQVESFLTVDFQWIFEMVYFIGIVFVWNKFDSADSLTDPMAASERISPSQWTCFGKNSVTADWKGEFPTLRGLYLWPVLTRTVQLFLIERHCIKSRLSTFQSFPKSKENREGFPIILPGQTLAKIRKMAYNQHVWWLNQGNLKPKGVPIWIIPMKWKTCVL